MIQEQMLLEEERYDRQRMLWGDKGQSRLANSKVAIVGLDAQGAYTALCLTSLGVGNIVLIDGDTVKEGEMFLDIEVPQGLRSREYSRLLKKINSSVEIRGYPVNLETRIDQLTLEGADVIVDATNSVRSKKLAVSYGIENNIPVLSTSSRRGYSKLVLFNDSLIAESLMPDFEGTLQDPLMALFMCGVTVEEVRKLIFNEQDAFLKEPVRYMLGDGYRFGFPKNKDHFSEPDPEIYSNLKIAFLGAGGLGCWGAIAASMMGFKRVDIYDYDVFESHNINRQVLAYDGIGRLKAEHIAEKIVIMSKGKTASNGYNMMILPGFSTEERYDLVFDFVDNRFTRAINSAYSIIQGIPMISAGALPYSARWDVHAEDQTQCMDCLFGIYEEGRKEEMIRRASCAANPDPSVVMSNSIAAVGAVLDAFTVFEPNNFGKPFNGEQVYRANGHKRFGTSPLLESCGCYSKTPPNLEISKEDVEDFVKRNPKLLLAGVQ